MTNQAEPGRPPAHDLSAFDLTKRSPEQVAQSFARWKAQRKRPPEAASQPLQARPSTAIEQDAAPDPSPGHEAPKPAPSKRAKPEYSDTFSALLAAGSEPTVRRAAWTPIGERPSPKQSRSPGRRLKAMSILAGAASVLALAGGALLELSDWRASTEAEPEVAQIHPPQIHPQQIPMAGPIAAAATRAPSVEWKLQRTVDLALMKAAPDGGAAKPMQPTPEPPMVQTASKAAIAAPPAPAPKKAAPETEQFVAKPFVPSAAPAPAVVPAAQRTAAIPAPPVAAAIRSGDPRPDALFQDSRDKSTGTAGNRVTSGGKPAAATGSESAVDARSATARSGKVVNGGNGDPRGEGSGGASVGPAATSASGGDAGDASAGSDAGSGNAGDDGATDGGSASSDAGGSDTGGADTGATAGGGDTSGGDTGGDDAGDASGSGDPSDGASGDGASGEGDSGEGDSGEGDSGSSDGEEGDSGGVGGAISGALGGVGDALGEDKNQKD